MRPCLKSRVATSRPEFSPSLSAAASTETIVPPGNRKRTALPGATVYLAFGFIERNLASEEDLCRAGIYLRTVSWSLNRPTKVGNAVGDDEAAIATGGNCQMITTDASLNLRDYRCACLGHWPQVHRL